MDALALIFRDKGTLSLVISVSSLPEHLQGNLCILW